MFRLLILTFFGTPRYTKHDVHHVHESPTSMLMPLVVLAILSMVAGFVGVPHVLRRRQSHRTVSDASRLRKPKRESPETTVDRIASDGRFDRRRPCGLADGISLLCRKTGIAGALATKAHAMYSIMLNKYYVDELYEAVIVWPMVRDVAGVPVEIRRRRALSMAQSTASAACSRKRRSVCATCKPDTFALMRLDSPGRRPGRRVVLEMSRFLEVRA